MNLTVFGATGGTGGHIVRQALDAGHKVTAVVRDPARLAVPAHPALEVFTAPSVTDPAAIGPALKGAEAVLSGIGPSSRKAPPTAAPATRAILGAMADAGVRRIVVVSATPVGPTPPGEGLFYRLVLGPVIKSVLKNVYADLAVMEEELRRSTAEWTVVRPPRLTDKPLTGKFRRVVGGNVPKGHFISRADLACAMLGALDDPATIRRPVGVGY
ncbi:uncharacterized protein YbjT (DUF2867 family) [Thermocatellispora tengchongensis]|uniref:Uncharacterized protein YbjT (DUF2867 family) n=1 Tax=Thermocatellispora tengchongensis TaxID=1073253 RepID=A0A840P1L8_9ACTN|nr:NAD(P)-binding oxidoreductase [Thermocatellispora tengchongensis]MBB5133262.1 uncharacterized protein YbjT (DUF2867 family) [Thermocatellispora tengchongensis]